jgi:hypothetical protein
LVVGTIDVGAVDQPHLERLRSAEGSHRNVSYPVPVLSKSTVSITAVDGYGALMPERLLST